MISFRHIATALCVILSTLPALAQKRVSADVEIKQVSDGKVVTMTKSVYCSNNGRLVIRMHKPVDCYIITNAGGETKVYTPSNNSVTTDNSGLVSSADELLSVFLSGRIDDLGLGLSGYTLSEVIPEEDGIVRKIYAAHNQGRTFQVELVTKDYLPIYCAYLDNQGNALQKTYLSNYAQVGRMPFPHRTTTITYTPKRDSTVMRTIYSNVCADGNAPEFDFQIPADAKPVANPAAAR